MQHLDEGTIHSWLDGALSAEEAARVKAHVEECPQCAAAVAEARGFIAASSRILTALDHVPRGVVPVAPGKPRNWAAWRAAAAVLVVALGSFAVLRERGGSRSSTAAIEPMSAVSANADAVAAAADRKAGATMQNESLPVSEAPSAKGPAKQTTAQRPAGPPVFDKVGNQAAMKAAAGGSGVTNALSARVPAIALSKPVEGPTIRVVGTPGSIGERRTLYEVAPGDTVLFAEVANVQTQGAMAATERGAAQSTDSSSARIRIRGTTPKPSALVIPRNDAGFSPAPASGVPTSSPVETLNGITTVTWTDPASGRTMRLSGRHSAVELMEIRRRIEQLRATEAAAKKNP